MSPMLLDNMSPMLLGNMSPMLLGNISPMLLGNLSPMLLGNIDVIILHTFYRQEIDIQRRLQRIECVITNFVPTVDVVAVAQRAAAIITTANPSFALEVVSGNFNCNSLTFHDFGLFHWYTVQLEIFED